MFNHELTAEKRLRRNLHSFIFFRFLFDVDARDESSIDERTSEMNFLRFRSFVEYHCDRVYLLTTIKSLRMTCSSCKRIATRKQFHLLWLKGHIDDTDKEFAY
jgi:hypothetical protein